MSRHSQQTLSSCVRIVTGRTPLSVSSPSPRYPPHSLIPSTPIRSLTSSSRNSSDPTSSNSPKRPSPYRLLQSHTFLSQFAPLHISGWRLDSLVPQERMVNPTSDIDDSSIINGNDVKKGNGGDLQDRRLIRAFLMGEGKQGWRDAMKLVQKAGQVIEQQDHHPTILITPSSDYSPSSFSLESTVNGYIVEISTHTHTPLPPYPIPTKNHPHKIRPGVTGKDINLAESLEKAWEEVMGGKEKIQIKKE